MLALRVAATPERLELRLAADPTALARLRRALGRFLQPTKASEAEAYEITVACGEAASNAIAHAGTDADAHFEVDARRSGGDIEIVVRDSGRWKRAGATATAASASCSWRRLMDSVEIRRGESGDRGDACAAGYARPRSP